MFIRHYRIIYHSKKSFINLLKIEIVKAWTCELAGFMLYLDSTPEILWIRTFIFKTSDFHFLQSF
jgi:hypothetical protein